jgi:hypothetical protein
MTMKMPFSTKSVSQDGVMTYWDMGDETKADIVRLHLNREGINALFDELGKGRVWTRTSQTQINRLNLDLNTKKGGSKPIPYNASRLHVMTTLRCSKEIDDVFYYTWGYGFKTLRRVTKYERKQVSSHKDFYEVIVSAIEKYSEEESHGEMGGRYYANKILSWLAEDKADFKPNVSILNAIHAVHDDEILDEDEKALNPHWVSPMEKGWQTMNEDEEVFEDKDEGMVDDASVDTKKEGFEGLGSLFG